MANILGILTFIVLCLTGFIALKNKKAYEGELENKVRAQEQLAKTQKRYETASKNLKDTVREREETDAEIAELEKKETEAKQNLETIKSQVEERTETIAANDEKLEETKQRTERLGDLEALASRMKAASAKLNELSASITTSKEKLEAVSDDSALVAMRKKFEVISSGRSLPSLKTRIRSVYPDWGFVTLAAGNSDGVTANSKLDVMRGGSLIAKLLVTSVERNSASASVVPDSLAPGVTLQPGDQVVPDTTPPPVIQKPAPAPAPAAGDGGATPETDPAAKPDGEKAEDDPFASVEGDDPFAAPAEPDADEKAEDATDKAADESSDKAEGESAEEPSEEAADDDIFGD